jgi:hypothetical protein
VRPVTIATLLSLPVRVRGIQVGRPLAVLLDESGERLVGLELLCGDGTHRFLPYSVADVRDDEIAVRSALTLLDERHLAFYRERARPLRDAGFVEPWVDEDGRVHEAQSAA